jgi:phosphoserine phosphatase RsbU/P
VTQVHILLAEDDPVTRAQLAAVLSAAGREVTVVADGTEAWEMLLSLKFPVVISDWIMPGIEGPELCRRLRARRARDYTYFILITATGGKHRYQEAMDAGVDDFITKPVNLDELKARLAVAERILGLRHEVSLLQGLLPICAYCKRIRGEGESWEPIERYVEERSQAQFSHGVCPECNEKHLRPQVR